MLYRLQFLQDDQRTIVRRHPALKSIPFASTCPRCRVQRSQRISRMALRRLLERGHPIEAFCEVCDEYWPIYPAERAKIARDIAAPVTIP
jgi:hypothetical protein